MFDLPPCPELNFETKTSHASQMALYEILALLCRLWLVMLQEAIVSRRLGLGTGTTWFQSLWVERIHLRVCWIEGLLSFG